jgi:glycosyltransferase involved in cell wall biosynthesis
MKILCVIDNLGSGGSQRQLVGIALGFRDSGHEVDFLTYHSELFYESDLRNSGIEITNIKSYNYLERFIKMRHFIRERRYNSVISFLDASNFICELAGFPYKNWKLVVGERSADPNIIKSFIRIIERWFHLSADFVVANSHANMQIVKSINPFLTSSKCKVIYNFVDFNYFHPAIEYVPRKNGKLKLIVVASHQMLKNLNGLIEAIAMLSQEERSTLEIEWYGDRIYEPFFDNSLIEAKQKIKFYKLEEIISFYPATKDLNLKIQQADVVGLFSFYEGFPNAVCEGMACAKPIICSAISDIPSILSYDKNLLFGPQSIESIRNTLIYIIGLTNNQLIAIGKINEKIAKDRFKKETIINQYLELIKS